MHSVIYFFEILAAKGVLYAKNIRQPYHKKDTDMLERIQRRATKMIQKLRDISYEICLKECSLTTLETRRLRGD